MKAGSSPITVAISIRLLSPSPELENEAWWFAIEPFVRQSDLLELVRRLDEPVGQENFRFIQFPLYTPPYDEWASAVPAPLPTDCVVSVRFSSQQGPSHEWTSIRDRIFVKDVDEFEEQNLHRDVEFDDWNRVPRNKTNGGMPTFSALQTSTLKALLDSAGDRALETLAASLNFGGALILDRLVVVVSDDDFSNHIFLTPPKPGERTDRYRTCRQALNGLMGRLDDVSVAGSAHVNVSGQEFDVPLDPTSGFLVAQLARQSLLSRAAADPTEDSQLRLESAARVNVHWIWVPLAPAHVITEEGRRTAVFVADVPGTFPWLHDPDGSPNTIVFQFSCSSEPTNVRLLEAFEGQLAPYFSREPRLVAFRPTRSDAQRLRESLASESSDPLELLVVNRAGQRAILRDCELSRSQHDWDWFEGEGSPKVLFWLPNEWTGETVISALLLRTRAWPNQSMPGSDVWEYTWKQADSLPARFDAITVTAGDSDVSDFRITALSTVTFEVKNSTERIEVELDVNPLPPAGGDPLEEFRFHDRWAQFALIPFEYSPAAGGFRRLTPAMTVVPPSGDPALPPDENPGLAPRYYHYVYRRRYDEDPRAVALDWAAFAGKERLLRFDVGDSYGRDRVLSSFSPLTLPTPLPSTICSLADVVFAERLPLLEWRLELGNEERLVLKLNLSLINDSAVASQKISAWRALAETAMAEKVQVRLIPWRAANTQLISEVAGAGEEWDTAAPNSDASRAFQPVHYGPDGWVIEVPDLQELCRGAILGGSSGLEDRELSFRLSTDAWFRRSAHVVGALLEIGRSPQYSPPIHLGASFASINPPLTPSPTGMDWFLPSNDGVAAAVVETTRSKLLALRTPIAADAGVIPPAKDMSVLSKGLRYEEGLVFGRGRLLTVGGFVLAAGETRCTALALSAPPIKRLHELGGQWVLVFERMWLSLRYLLVEGPPQHDSMVRSDYENLLGALEGVHTEFKGFANSILESVGAVCTTWSAPLAVQYAWATLSGGDRLNRLARKCMLDRRSMSGQPPALLYVEWSAVDFNKELNADLFRASTLLGDANGVPLAPVVLDTTVQPMTFGRSPSAIGTLTPLDRSGSPLMCWLSDPQASRFEDLVENSQPPAISVAAFEGPSGPPTSPLGIGVDLPVQHLMQVPVRAAVGTTRTWLDPEQFDEVLTRSKAEHRPLDFTALCSGRLIASTSARERAEVQAVSFHDVAGGYRGESVSWAIVGICDDRDVALSGTPWARDSFAVSIPPAFDSGSVGTSPRDTEWWDALSHEEHPMVTWQRVGSVLGGVSKAVTQFAGFASALRNVAEQPSPPVYSAPEVEFFLEKGAAGLGVVFLPTVAHALRRVAVALLSIKGASGASSSALLIALHHTIWRRRDVVVTQRRDYPHDEARFKISAQFAQQAVLPLRGALRARAVSVDASSQSPVPIDPAMLDARSFLLELLRPRSPLGSDWESAFRWLLNPYDEGDGSDCITISGTVFQDANVALPTLLRSGNLKETMEWGQELTAVFRFDTTIVDLQSAVWSQLQATQVGAGRGAVDISFFWPGDAVPFFSVFRLGFQWVAGGSAPSQHSRRPRRQSAPRSTPLHD